MVSFGSGIYAAPSGGCPGHPGSTLSRSLSISSFLASSDSSSTRRWAVSFFRNSISLETGREGRDNGLGFVLWLQFREKQVFSGPLRPGSGIQSFQLRCPTMVLFNFCTLCLSPYSAGERLGWGLPLKASPSCLNPDAKLLTRTSAGSP